MSESLASRVEDAMSTEPPSATVAVSSEATGASLAEVTVMATVAVSVAVPSLMV